MALFEESVAASVATSVVVSVAAVLLTPLLLPVMATAGRPMLKAAIRGGIMLYERGRELTAELSETVEDVAAEVRAEMQEEAKPGVVPAQRARSARSARKTRTHGPEAEVAGETTEAAEGEGAAKGGTRSSARRRRTKTA